MGNPMALLNLTLSDLEKSKSLRYFMVDLYGIHIFTSSL